MNWKHWLIISTTSLFLACGQDHGNNAPKGTALGTGNPSSGPSKDGAPHSGGGEKDPHGEADGPEDPMVTVHLMHRFMAALSEKPTNAEPSPELECGKDLRTA